MKTTSSPIENATEEGGVSKDDLWELPGSEMVNVPKRTLRWIEEQRMRGHMVQMSLPFRCSFDFGGWSDVGC